MNRYRYAFAAAFRFSPGEFWPFIVTVLFSGFILGFRSFFYYDQDLLLMDAAKGFSSSIYYSILFLVLYFLFIASQKYVAAYMGYDCRMEIWKYGPVIGIFITFMTFGLLPFLHLGSVQLKEDPKLRLGKYRHYLNVKDLMYVGITGPLFLLAFLIFVINPLFFITKSALFSDIIVVVAWILLFSALPLPKTNGLNVLWKSRIIWAIYMGFSVGMFLLLRQLQFVTYVVAAIIGIVAILLIRKISSSGLFNL